MDPSFTDTNLYELIGAERGCAVSDIKKAYRKKALSCHPDKNPDNPRAAELFHELTRALEILTDPAAREAYDKVLTGREQAKLRVRELDAKRRKLKEQLEAREEAYRKSTSSYGQSASDEKRFQAEVERLRKEGSRQVEEEVALVTKRIREELRGIHNNDDTGPFRIKVKWKPNSETSPGYDRENLHRIFSKYGSVAGLVLSQAGKGRAIVEYNLRSEAELAANTELGFAHAPLTLEKLWLEKKEKRSERYTENHTDESSIRTTDSRLRANQTSHECTNMNEPKMTDDEFENMVLKNLRRAEELKRLSATTNSFSDKN